MIVRWWLARSHHRFPARAWETSAMLRVMSYNIRFDNPEDGANAWPQRREDVCRLIEHEGPDVLGLQEALARQLNDIELRLPDYACLGMGREGGARGEFCAILFRTSRLQALRDGTFWLSQEPERAGSRGWDAALPRIATWAELEDIEARTTLFVFNTHFDHKGPRAVRHSSRLLNSKVIELSSHRPALIMGDFNFEERSEEYRFLTSTWQDAYRAAREGHTGPDATFHSGDGFAGTGPASRIDFIFTKGAVTHRHAISAFERDGRHPSDHLPVLADISFPAVR